MSKLDSLNTPGGHLAILLFLTLAFGVSGVWLMLKFGPTAPAVALLVGSFSNFSGAVLIMLRSGPNVPPAPTDSSPKV